MSGSRMYLAAFTCVVAIAASASADTKADPREKLETAIPEAIRLLEAKEYVTFLKSFVAPDDLKKLTEKGSLEEFAKQFGQGKSARLLKALKSAKDSKPALDPDGKKATYNFMEEVEVKKSITFVKVDKYWYIQN